VPLKSPEIIITPSTFIEPEEEKLVTGRRRRSVEEAERLAQLEKEKEEKEEKKEEEPTPLYRDGDLEINSNTGGIPLSSNDKEKEVGHVAGPHLDNGINGHTGNFDASFAAAAVVIAADAGMGF